CQINSTNWGNFSRRARRPLQNHSCPFKRGPPERWPSGLRRTLGKRVCGKPYRGFESHSLRHGYVLHRSPPSASPLSGLNFFVLDVRVCLLRLASIHTLDVGTNGGSDGTHYTAPCSCEGPHGQYRTVAGRWGALPAVHQRGRWRHPSLLAVSLLCKGP